MLRNIVKQGKNETNELKVYILLKNTSESSFQTNTTTSEIKETS